MIAEKGAAMIRKHWVTKAEKGLESKHEKQTNDNGEKEDFKRKIKVEKGSGQGQKQEL